MVLTTKDTSYIIVLGIVISVLPISSTMSRMLEAHTECEETQCHSIREWQEDTVTKWDDHHKNNVQWGTGIADMPVEKLAKERAGNPGSGPGHEKEDRDGTARQDGGGLEDIQHAGTMQDGEPEERQLQQQPKPKPKLKLLLKQQPELQHRTKPKPTPTPARMWTPVQL